MNEVVVVAGVRTPVCRSGRQLKDVAAGVLASVPVKEAIRRSGVP
jgi:acetyl-CoA acetyltransferase